MAQEDKDRIISDLAMMLRRIVWRLRKDRQYDLTRATALNLLAKYGLQGEVQRHIDENEAARIKDNPDNRDSYTLDDGC